jgi:hypothetical protein
MLSVRQKMSNVMLVSIQSNCQTRINLSSLYIQ